MRSPFLPVARADFARIKKSKTLLRRTEIDAGDTLIEILVAIIILGITAVAVLGAFATDLKSASVYKNTSALEIALKNFAEQATYQIQYDSSPIFSPCALVSGSATSTGSNVDYHLQPINYSPPAGSGISISTSISYLYRNSSFSASCDAGQLEPQLFTATATNSQGGSATLHFVVASFSHEAYSQPS